jgi:uncharacterized protein (TIGR02271 family)
MTNPSDIQDMMGRTAVDAEGNKIGKIGQVYLDDQSGQPQWVTISTGLFGKKESFAPLAGSRRDGDDLVLSVTKDQVKDAPNMDADGHLEDAENDQLYSYYGHSTQSAATAPTDNAGYAAANSQNTAANDDAQTVGHDTSGPNTDDAMTLSEEQVNVGTQQVEAGRARLRKYVVTEDVTTTVPVSHEEVRLEREPITDQNRGDAMSGGDITEEEHEVTLHAEQPVVQKEAVPVERVRLSTETVTENQDVTEQVRKEQIDEPDVDLSNR